MVKLVNVSITGGTLTSSAGGIFESVDTWSGSLDADWRDDFERQHAKLK